MRPPHLVLLLAAFTILASAAAAPPGRLLTGIAVDPQGQPVAGAAVWLPPDDLTDEQYTAYVKAGPAAVTGADGRFTVSLPKGMDESAVDVCAPGSLTGRIEPGDAADKAATEPVTVVIRPGGRIFGQVVDAAGEPVAGMIVGTTLAGSTPPDVILQSSPCSHSGIESGAVTDATGRFTLEPLEPGWYSVRGLSGAVQSAPVRLAPGQALGGVRLVAPGAQVTGHVTARRGAPVPRATVSVSGVTTTTDAAGLYRLAGVPFGSLSVFFADGSHGTVYRQTEIAAGENRLDLVLPDPLVLRGRVLRPDGKPASGATVAARSLHTATAADGSFQLRLPSGNGDETLTIQAAGFAPAELMIKDQPQQPAIDVRLVRPGTIAGRIVGLRAPAGTQITAESFLFTQQLLHVDAVAGAEGRFHLPGLAPGTWVLTAGQGERRKVVTIAVAAGAESAVDIAFPPTHQVSGWVVDSDGRPAACDTVVLSGKANRFSAPCGAGGTFALEAEDGSYDPGVSAGGHDRFDEPMTVEVAGAPVGRVEIRLLNPVTVAGHILGLAPGEIPDSIQAERIGETYVLRSAFGTADQDGGYHLEILPGDWEIKAQLMARTATRRLHIPADVTRINADLTFSSRDPEKEP